MRNRKKLMLEIIAVDKKLQSYRDQAIAHKASFAEAFNKPHLLWLIPLLPAFLLGWKIAPRKLPFLAVKSSQKTCKKEPLKFGKYLGEFFFFIALPHLRKHIPGFPILHHLVRRYFTKR